MPIPEPSDQPVLHPDATRDRYRSVLLVLLAATILGTALAIAAGVSLSSFVLLDAALSLALASGVLAGVTRAQRLRAGEPAGPGAAARIELEPPATEDLSAGPAPPMPSSALARIRARLRAAKVGDRVDADRGAARQIEGARAAVAWFGFAAALLLLFTTVPPMVLTPWTAGGAAGVSLVAAGLAAVAARYLSDIDPAQLPESDGLCQGARVVAWILVLTTISIGLTWFGADPIARVIHYALIATNAAFSYSLLTTPQQKDFVYPLARTGVTSITSTRSRSIASWRRRTTAIAATPVRPSSRGS